MLLLPNNTLAAAGAMCLLFRHTKASPPKLACSSAQRFCAKLAPIFTNQSTACPLKYVPQVLCASNAAHDQVVPVTVPEGVPLGERVFVQGYDQAPLEEVGVMNWVQTSMAVCEHLLVPSCLGAWVACTLHRIGIMQQLQLKCCVNMAGVGLVRAWS